MKSPDEKYEDLEGDYFGQKLTHVANPAGTDYSLCGISFDEPDDDEIEKFSEKKQYGSNCKLCIGFMNSLRKIRK